MAIPEYMKIRQYLYNIVVQSGAEPVKIPSENTLCFRFGVSRKTVRLAIKGLVEDNFLTTKQGVGTFTNPLWDDSQVIKLPVVGIITTDGKNTTVNPVNMGIFEAIIQNGMNCELLFLPNTDEPAKIVETLKNNVDAVVWQNPPCDEDNINCLNKIFASDIPLLLVEPKNVVPEYFDLISTRNSAGSEALAGYFFRHGHEKVLFIRNATAKKTENSSDNKSSLSPVRNHLQKLSANSVIDEVSLREFIDGVKEGTELLERHTIIYTVSTNIRPIMQALEMKQVKVPEDISILSYGPSNGYFFNGKKPSYIDNSTSLGDCVIEWLNTKLQPENRSTVFCKTITNYIVDGETVAKV